jgi:Leucine-rich repeat (LRR) protein
MYSKFPGAVCALLITAALTGCKTYSVSLNNNVVYTPPSLFKDYEIADSHLRDCVEQAIVDKHVTKAEDLKQLSCSHASVASLAGLEKFYALEQLNLAENNIASINPLANLGQLRVLILRSNNLTTAEPLLHLLHLQQLDVADNNKLACRDLQQLQANFHAGELALALPAQCEKKS